MASINRKTEKPVVVAGQILLVKTHGGEPYAENGEGQTMSDILKVIGDDVADIVILTFAPYGNISILGDVIDAYIGANDLTPEDEDKLPRFVRESLEWGAFVSDYNDAATDDARYGDYESQHRLGVYNTVARHA